MLSGIVDVSTGGFCTSFLGADCTAVANDNIKKARMESLLKCFGNSVCAAVMPMEVA